jgi:C-terminal processing protease CtpA/Prc
MRTVSAVILAAILLAVPRPSIAQEPKRVDCHKDLKEAYEFIDVMWSFKIFKPGYVDLEREYRRLENEAKSVEWAEACAHIIARFMSTLGDGHSSLSYYPGVEYTAPDIELRTLRERLSSVPGQLPVPHVYVISRDTTNDTLKAIRPGTEITAIDGTPVTELHEFWKNRVSGSTSQWIDYMIDRELLLGPADSLVELDYRSPSGKPGTTVVRRPSWKDEDEREREYEIYLDTARIATWERREDGWGYMKYTDFAFKDYETTVELFDEALDSVIDAPGLVIDLRGNGGGYVAAYLDAAGRFLAQEEILGYFQQRQPGQEGVYEMLDQRTGDAVLRMPERSEPRRPVYTGPVVLLVDRSCFSACESFAGGLQAIDRVLVVGPEASGGGSGFVSGVRLPSKAIIRFSWVVGWLPDGTQIEGNGVTPDVIVRLRPRDFASGRDRVLERAIKALENGEAKPLLVAGGETDG